MIDSKRFFDTKSKTYQVSVLPGDFYITNQLDETVVTILGSCVAACIRSKKNGYGGMNHFLLAEPNDSITSPSSRYGSYAMEQLINEILKHGGTKADFEVKIFGGSDLFHSIRPIGTNNIRFIRNYLQKEGIKISAEDVGGTIPRKIFYNPVTGKVSRILIKPHEETSVFQQEETYKQKLKINQVSNNTAGSIELF